MKSGGSALDSVIDGTGTWSSKLNTVWNEGKKPLVRAAITKTFAQPKRRLDSDEKDFLHPLSHRIAVAADARRHDFRHGSGARKSGGGGQFWRGRQIR